MSEQEDKGYSADELKRLWKLSHEDLALAPGQPGARIREARFIMQAKVAFEASRSGAIIARATIVMAAATVVLAIATIVLALQG